MTRSVPPLVDIADIVRLVGRENYNEGLSSIRHASVHEVEWDAAAGRLSGEVEADSDDDADPDEREDHPFWCRIDVVPTRNGLSRPIDNACTCVEESDCKHVAALVLSGNAAHVRHELSAVTSSPEPKSTRPVEASPAEWKRLLEVPPAETPVVAPFGSFGWPARTTAPPRPVVPMGLQFEVREQTPRTNDRWRGATAKPVKAINPGHGDYRLGVRPVVLNDKGHWVRGNVAWNHLSFQLNRLNVNTEHHRWLCEFSALYRAVRGMYTSQEPEWIYLDTFTSPLLWPLLAEAAGLGITFVGSRKNSTVTVGTQATVGLDATSAAPNARSGTAAGATPASAGALSHAPAGLHLAATLLIDGRAYPAESAGTISTHGVYSFELAPQPAFILAPTTTPLTHEQGRLLGHPSAFAVPTGEVEEFLTDFYPRLRRAIPVTSTDASVRFPEIVPPVLVLTAAFRPKHTLQLDWDWEYHDGATAVRLPLRPNLNDPVERDPEAEGEIRDRVRLPLTSRTLQGIDAAEFTEGELPALALLPGVRVDVTGTQPDYRELTETPELTITTVETDQPDWFDLGVIVTVGGTTVPFAPLFAALSRGQTKLMLVDNSYLSLQQPEFERLRELIEEARALQEWDTGLRISRYQASLWADFEDLAEETEQAQAWRAAVSGLLDVTRIEPAPLPTGVQATLRPYQRDGFSWLAFLWQHQLGGILADDMGLGKTLQALVLMAHASAPAGPDPTGAAPNDQSRGRRPFLVVAPTSVVSNWLSEAARFTPGLVVRGVTETQAKGGRLIADAAAGADVVVTSYALFRLDFDAYQAQGWAGLLLDEAQFVKNRAAQVHICARELNTPFKLAITGTPMENNLMDLHALFAIVAPGLFASGRKFTDDYVRPIERGQSPQLLGRLRRRIRPLLMRRTKELVATDLPPKQEQELRIALNPRHKKLYDTFLQRERQKLLGLIDDMNKNRFIIFRSLTLLRMLSLDASLVDEKYASIPSSKLDALFDQLDDVVAEGHRALIFSQFTSFLKLAAARLDAQGVAYCYLDGSTLRRSDVIDRFKTGADPVFLISLKAGGFGLNLTEADYVFLLDPWWNPATEAQAVDRTHRIGQTKNVMVYRMVATGTIEEKVMALKATKAKLFTAVMDDDAMFSEALTADDVRALLEA